MSLIETKTKEVTVYVVAGKEFLDKSEAEKYEKELEKELSYTFFTVNHSPDLTEGRGYYKTTVLAVPKNYAAQATALQYCVDSLGKPLEFVMGVAPMPNWVISGGRKFETIESLGKVRK